MSSRGTFVKTDTCQDNTCAGTCEQLFVCQNDETGRCTTQRCTRDAKCEAAYGEGWSCTGDPDCCTGTCGVLANLPDPQCEDGSCESCYAPACLDNDNDGYGYPGGNAECPQGTAEDCDDDNYDVNPGATEAYGVGTTCSDGLDNDCNGVTDAADSKCDEPVEPPPCSDIASASTGRGGAGSSGSAWYLLVLAGVVAVSGAANRLFRNKKE
jgi:hypothetical protein